MVFALSQKTHFAYYLTLNVLGDKLLSVITRTINESTSTLPNWSNDDDDDGNVT